MTSLLERLSAARLTRLRMICATVGDWHLWVGQHLLAAYRATVAQLDLTDWMLGGGLLLIAGGLAFVYWPAALIVPGVLIFAVGLIGSLRQVPDRDEEDS